MCSLKMSKKANRGTLQRLTQVLGTLDSVCAKHDQTISSPTLTPNSLAAVKHQKSPMPVSSRICRIVGFTCLTSAMAIRGGVITPIARSLMPPLAIIGNLDSSRRRVRLLDGHFGSPLR